MGHDRNGTKEHAHELIEQLPPIQLSAVVGLLEAMLDPVARALANAPVDDEPLTAEDVKALAEANEWSKNNQGTSQEQVMAELGITREEVSRFQNPK